ncbi:MAG: hypothetical protein LIP01_07220 [Tannerellaceae bacterium]|nr:hypothetical protein [Tannerellaceae bacterium]
MFSTPILFLIFNRPDTIRKVFERIREIQPARLYVAADAPRPNRPGEAEKCKQTRAIIQEIDWECEVKTLFREENLGCKNAVSGAITWFFEQEEQGIILEDDCLPDPSFFPFCETLLEKYKNDERVGHIGGNSHLPGIIPPPLSYDFCMTTHIWGWATWRRVWKNVDMELSFWNMHKQQRSLLFCNKPEEIYYTSFIEDSIKQRNGMNPWSVFYSFSLRLQNQLSVYPAVNLVTNIGLNDPDATHTKGRNNKLYVPSEPVKFPLVHPEYRLNNQKINRASVRKNYFSYKRLVRYFLKLY